MLGTLTNNEITAFLSEQCFAHLGCESEGKIYVVPISYVFDGTRILGQTKAGLKIDMIRKNPHVCVQIERIESIASWKSVILWGKVEELKGHDAIMAMVRLIDHLGSQIEDLGSSRSPRDVTPGRIDGQPQVDIVYSIAIDEMTGRFESPYAVEAGPTF